MAGQLRFNSDTGQMEWGEEPDLSIPGANSGVPAAPVDPTALQGAQSQWQQERTDERTQALEQARAMAEDKRKRKTKEQLAIVEQQKAAIKTQEARAELNPDHFEQEEAAQQSIPQTDEQQAQQTESILSSQREQGFQEATDLASRGLESVEAQQEEDILKIDATTPEGAIGEGLTNLAKGHLTQNKTDEEAGIKTSERDETLASMEGHEAGAIGRGIIRRGELEEKHEQLRQDYKAELASDIQPPSPSILNLIGVALGGFLASRSGGPNVAAELLNARISRDTQTALANRKMKMAQFGEDLDESKQEFNRADDTLRYELLQMGKQKQSVKTYLDAQIERGAYTGKALANAQKISGQYGIDIGKLAQDTADRQLALDEKNRNFALKQQKANKGKGGGVTRKQEIAETEASNTVWDPDANNGQGAEITADLEQLKAIKLARGVVKRSFGIRINGKPSAVLIPEHREKEIIDAIDERNDYKQATSIAKETLNQLGKKEGFDLKTAGKLKLDEIFGGGSNAMRQWKAAHGYLFTIMKNRQGAGASLTETEVKPLMAQLGGDPDKFFNSHSLNEVVDIFDDIQNKVDRSVQLRIGTRSGVSADSISFGEANSSFFTKDMVERATTQAPLSGDEQVAEVDLNLQSGNKQEASAGFDRLLARASKGLGAGEHDEGAITGQNINDIPRLISRARDEGQQEEMFRKFVGNKKAFLHTFPKLQRTYTAAHGKVRGDSNVYEVPQPRYKETKTSYIARLDAYKEKRDRVNKSLSESNAKAMEKLRAAVFGKGNQSIRSKAASDQAQQDQDQKERNIRSRNESLIHEFLPEIGGRLEANFEAHEKNKADASDKAVLARAKRRSDAKAKQAAKNKR